MFIEAKDKNGNPVRVGDRVFVVWDNGDKACGRIAKIRAPESFRSLGGAKLQTYEITCPGNKPRPAHAWHIKKVFDNRKPQRRKAA